MYNSLDNFRAVGSNDVSKPKIKVYRSARLDKITLTDLRSLRNELNIRAVIDFRSPDYEYQSNDSPKLLDENHNLQVVDIRSMEKASTTQIIWDERHMSIDQSQTKHFMTSFYGKYFVHKLFFSWNFEVTQMLKILYMWFISKFTGSNMAIWKYVSDYFNTKGLVFMYKRTIDFCGISICSAFQLLNKANNIPAVICCHAGKDRTGILSALLLAMCGFDRELIVSDYNKTEISLPPEHVELRKCTENMRGAPRHVMESLLSYIDDKYGSVPQYLASIGFSFEEQLELKHLILCK